jgi:uncharacterized protein
MIPGRADTLRIGGVGETRTDPDLLARFKARGFLPDIVLKVHVREVSFPGAKSIQSARLWQPEYWPDSTEVPSFAGAAEVHGALELRRRTGGP